jgi:hypothetical protein
MPASANIPAIAQAHVSERAKKTLDLVSFTPLPVNCSNLTTATKGRRIRRKRMHSRRRHIPKTNRRRPRPTMERPPTHHRRTQDQSPEARVVEYVFAQEPFL